MREVKINGLLLPQEFVELIDAGRWKLPENKAIVDEIFGDHGPLAFYSLEYMPFENKYWIQTTDPMFIGTPDALNPPGDIDLQRSLLIGDLGIGWDSPIALDYRVSQDKPRVLNLRWSSDGKANRWVEIAPDIVSFAERFGL